MLILSAAASVFLTVAWIPLAVLFFQGNSQSLGLGSASPLLGVALLTTEMMHASAADWPVAALAGPRSGLPASAARPPDCCGQLLARLIVASGGSLLDTCNPRFMAHDGSVRASHAQAVAL